MSPREYFRTPSTMGIASELRLDHSGRSRREWLLHDRVVSEVKSWGGTIGSCGGGLFQVRVIRVASYC